jgi:hypothetical protein
MPQARTVPTERMVVINQESMPSAETTLGAKPKTRARNEVKFVDFMKWLDQ